MNINSGSGKASKEYVTVHGTPVMPSVPLTTSKMANQQSPPNSRKEEQTQKTPVLNEDSELHMHNLVSQLNEKLSIAKENSSKKPQLAAVVEPRSSGDDHLDPQEELSRLKLQLEAAQNKIARQDRELFQQKVVEHGTGLPSDADTNFQFDHISEATGGTSPGSGGQHVAYSTNAERPAFPDRSFALSPGPYDRFHGPWGNGLVPRTEPISATTHQTFQQSAWNPFGNAPGNPSWLTNEHKVAFDGSSRFPPAPQPQRQHNVRLDTFENDQSFANPAFESGYRRTSMPTTRPSSAAGPFYSSFNHYTRTNSPEFSPPMTPMLLQHMNGQQQAQQPYARPIGSPLSPMAMEFSGNIGMSNPHQTTPWNTQTGYESTSTYMAPMEPMNYRRLLDRNMSCNWSYIVDKIVCSNDQQASIFLQQKLKVATAEQKYELIEAIVKQAYPLMINRFGNFLIQRCFEHGSPEQVIAIAKTIQGHVLNLSTDAFGCHVVQKAFDVVPDDYKAVMVHELLRNIPETVIHRYACHVWQKLFELRWADSPPQIMKYVNEALRGMWHEVALGETGSLVVQNIFENCLEEDKRPCINEVLASIDIVSHGQFGNWCIQHVCEHGAPADKSRAIEHVLRFSTEYSTDQFASKVVEKCLKVGGAEFLERYLDRVCEARPDRPRMPLIDIAGDQYGNYLVQYILINANPQHREIVANHVRKHMVSLRGSKFGSRVAMLCSNPASATRPGPPMGLPMNNRFAQNMPMTFPRTSSTGSYR